MTSLPEDERIIEEWRNRQNILVSRTELIDGVKTKVHYITEKQKAHEDWLRTTLATIRHEEAQKRDEAVREERERIINILTTKRRQGGGEFDEGQARAYNKALSDIRIAITPRDTV